MTLQDLLNTDVRAIGEALRQGWAWWTDELGQLAPERWRRARSADRPVADLGEAGPTLRLWRRGRFSEVAPGARPRAADLGLAPRQVLVRQVVLPAVGRADVLRLVALELDRLTPFQPDQVYIDVERVTVDRAQGRQTLRLAVVPRPEAEAALERARRHGLSPLRLGVLEAAELSFDFLPAIRAAGRGGRPDRALPLWWAAAGALLALNLSILVLRDVDDLANLRQTVELQRPTATLAASLRRRVELEARARRGLLDRRAQNDPLRIEAAVTRAFAPPAWIQRLEWNGRTLRLVGYAPPGYDVLAAIRRSRALGEPRALTRGEAASPAAKPPFDLVTQPTGAPRR